MAERGQIGRRMAAWIGWGVAAGAAYLVALPLLAGGLALVPIAVVAFEDGVIEAAIAIASGILMLLVLGGGLNLPALGLLLAGLWLGSLLRRVHTPFLTVAPAVVLSVAGLLGLFLLPAAYGGVLSSLPAADTRVLLRLLADNGIHGQSLQQILRLTLPAFIPVYAGLVTVEGFFVARLVLLRRARSLPQLLPFWRWTAPAWLPPLYLVAMATQLAGTIFGGLGQIGTDAWFVSIWAGVPLLFVGLAVVDHWLVRAHMPQPARGILLVLAVLLPVGSQLLTWVGVLDQVFDIRHLREQQG